MRILISLGPPPPYFETMPTLPPELLLLILRHAASAPVLDDPYQRFKWPWTVALRERADFLRSAALVARSWTGPAQSLLTQILYVNHWRAEHLVGLATPISVVELCFTPSMRHFGSQDIVLDTLRRTQGVKRLSASHNEDEEKPLLPYLALPNFEDVTSLDIRHAGAGSALEQSGALTLAFHLTHLSLRTPTSPVIVDALLPAVHGTLIHLHINLLRASGMEDEVFTAKALLEAVAPHLISLEISHYTNRVGQGIDLPRILASCVKLESLHLPFDRHVDPQSRLHLAPLRAIPPTVRFLHLQDYWPLWAVTEWLSEGKSKVEHIEIAPRPRPIPSALWHLREEEEALERKCGELKVRFSRSELGQQPI